MFEALYQTFEEPKSGIALAARLSAFREELARRKLTGFVIPRADQQQNEYVAPSEERLAWLTGFTGSAGQAIVLTQTAAVFVDGRYTLQAAKQVDPKAWNIEPLADPPPESWLASHLKAGDRLGFDPWLHTSAAAERLAAVCAKAGAEVCSTNAVRAAADASNIVCIRMEASLSRPGTVQSHADPVQFIGVPVSVGPPPRRFNDVPAPQPRRQLVGGVPCVNSPRVLLNRHSVGMPR